MRYLKNLETEDIPLSHLTHKAVMLLALVSAQRAQTMHLLKLSNFVYGTNTILIKVPHVLKYSNVKNLRFYIELRAHSDPQTCVVEFIKENIKRTKEICGTFDQLFISYHQPHKAVSRETISRWIMVKKGCSSKQELMFQFLKLTVHELPLARMRNKTLLV